MAVVPLILTNLQRGLRERFAELSPMKRRALNAVISINRALTHGRPRLGLSRALLKDVHQAFGGSLRALLVGGAFTEPATIAFFHDLGIPIYNGYGCTEACTAITLNDQKPFRPDTVGRPVRGMEIRTRDQDAEGIGEVIVRSKTVMSQYLDDPEMTAETIVDGWLLTGDLGRIDASGHLQLFGRRKNMIVTEEGKNIYPEDVESVFEGIAAKEYCVFAANFLWPARTMVGEQLVLVLHPESGEPVGEQTAASLAERNRRLLNYKRVSGFLIWDFDFPRTASLKIKRAELAEQIRQAVSREAVVPL
jgi:long-chain acyl-CoA synthetase